MSHKVSKIGGGVARDGEREVKKGLVRHLEKKTKKKKKMKKMKRKKERRRV